MTDTDRDVSRRGFLQTAAGTTTVAAASGSAAAAQSGESEGDGGESGGGGGGSSGPPDFGGWLDDVGNYSGSVTDATGQDQATVQVGAQGNGGAFAFAPPAIHVDNGATVVWEWTGEGGSHNVVEQDGAFESELVGESGYTFEQTFEEDGIYNYYCAPHQGNGMKASVVVGTDYPTIDTGSGAGPSDLPSSGLTLGFATLFVMAATLGLAYFFIRYGGDYGEFEE